MVCASNGAFALALSTIEAKKCSLHILYRDVLG